MQRYWLGHCEVLNSPMTPASRLTCTVQVEGPLVPGRNLLVWYLIGDLVFALLACFWGDGVCSRFVVYLSDAMFRQTRRGTCTFTLTLLQLFSACLHFIQQTSM